ncbi:MAG: hypothetical protein AB4372_37915 [Xenococcus sp. (in: cyanobacteria)]
MAKIKIYELRPAGSELLQDSESFLNELSDHDLENVVGGNNINSAVFSQFSNSVASKNEGGLLIQLEPSAVAVRGFF